MYMKSHKNFFTKFSKIFSGLSGLGLGCPILLPLLTALGLWVAGVRVGFRVIYDIGFTWYSATYVNYRKCQGHLFNKCSKICRALPGVGLGWSILLGLWVVLGLVLELGFVVFQFRYTWYCMRFPVHNRTRKFISHLVLALSKWSKRGAIGRTLLVLRLSKFVQMWPKIVFRTHIHHIWA